MSRTGQKSRGSRSGKRGKDSGTRAAREIGYLIFHSSIRITLSRKPKLMKRHADGFAVGRVGQVRDLRFRFGEAPPPPIDHFNLFAFLSFNLEGLWKETMSILSVGVVTLSQASIHSDRAICVKTTQTTPSLPHMFSLSNQNIANFFNVITIHKV